MKRIALVGMPNTGKSTFFNRVTGASARVGNWPGVTVDLFAARVLSGRRDGRTGRPPGHLRPRRHRRGREGRPVVPREHARRPRRDHRGRAAARPAAAAGPAPARARRARRAAAQHGGRGAASWHPHRHGRIAARTRDAGRADGGQARRRARGGAGAARPRRRRERRGDPGDRQHRARRGSRGRRGRADHGSGGRHAGAHGAGAHRPRGPRAAASAARTADLLRADVRRVPGRVHARQAAAGRDGVALRRDAPARARAGARAAAGPGARLPARRRVGGRVDGGRVRAAGRAVLPVHGAGRGHGLSVARGVPHRRADGEAGARRAQLRHAAAGLRLQRAGGDGHADHALARPAAADAHDRAVLAVLGAPAGLRVPRGGAVRAGDGRVGAVRPLSRELRARRC